MAQMKKQALCVITILVVLLTILGAGCTTSPTQNKTTVGNASKAGGAPTTPTARDSTTGKYDTVGGNVSRVVTSTVHEARVVVHFAEGVWQLVTNTTRELHHS